MTPEGRLCDLRCGEVLINQVLPTPCEWPMTRLILRDSSGVVVPLIGPEDADAPTARTFQPVNERCARWRIASAPYEVEVALQLHDSEPAWRWRVTVWNTADAPRRVELFYGQDLALAHEGFARMNEAYCSQYLDHRMERDSTLGPVLLTRQNQAQGDAFPWLSQACVEGAAAWSTDGFQFFGSDHRLTGRPRALGLDRLDDANLQYEFAYPALQSPVMHLPPNGEASVTFVCRFVPDHSAPSGPDDLPPLRSLTNDNGWQEAQNPETTPLPPVPVPPSLFDSPWLHGDELEESDWAALFPGEPRHLERDATGARLSFFTSPDVLRRHIVSRRKEERVERPHAHILRTGRSLWMDDDLLGTTVGMAGAFNAQVFLGNTNLARFLSVLRNPLNVMRGSGQRIFVNDGGVWKQLGIPSAFEMGLRHARWLYKWNDTLLDVMTLVSEDAPEIRLRVKVRSGEPRAFLLSHMIVMGDNEMAQPVSMTFDEAQGRIECRVDPESFVGQRWPGLRFALEADPGSLERMGGDELLFDAGETRGSPFAVLVTKPVETFALTLRGEGATAARTEGLAEAAPVPLPRLNHAEPAAQRTGDLLPWFAHDAWIHFTTPHGLEQYGGAAWGTRDVCQGPVEWLLATRQYATVRRILLKVFEQQYAEDGSWPQWFMFEPFRFIQSRHSHGDIVFWPLMALCQYIEASGDYGILSEAVPYTDTETFAPTAHSETIAAHVVKILDQHDSRCLPGTALVNYGDGDWDDTLQPADPALRTRMTSAWTVGLAYDAFRRYREVCDRAGMDEVKSRLDETLERMGADFRRWLMPDGVTAGFLIFEADGPRPLLHPLDTATGIRYRLLPMTRAVLSELFTPEEARAHFDLIHRFLEFPDGVRLMSDPIPYRGGVERRFKRAETAANFGREVGLMYSHAHLRYAEALARLGDGDGLWNALQKVNPILLAETVPNARLRQSNVYFTSSDGDFPDRYEAGRRFDELKAGTVAVKGGWRLYSSGPGLFVHKVITRLLGLRESFGDIVLDPVLPRSLDGLTVEWEWDGFPLTLTYRVRERSFAPSQVLLNGEPLPTDRREANPYREGGVRVASSLFLARLKKDSNRLEIVM